MREERRRGEWRMKGGVIKEEGGRSEGGVREREEGGRSEGEGPWKSMNIPVKGGMRTRKCKTIPLLE